MAILSALLRLRQRATVDQHRRQLGAFAVHSRDAHGGELRGLCPRQAIAAAHDFVATGHAGQQGVNRVGDAVADLLGHLVVEIGAIDKVLLYMLL